MTVHIIEIQRRFSDMDFMRHVNNAVYGDYLQEARIRLNRIHRAAGHRVPSQVIARQEIDYVRPLHLKDEPVVVELWVEAVGRSSYTMQQRIRDDEGWLSAKARTVIVAIDKASERSRVLPEEFRAFLISEIENIV